MTVAVGDVAPLFDLPSTEGRIKLDRYLGKWVVLYFYPADNTRNCTIEACSFRNSHQDFVDAGAVVIGVSGDSLESHQGFQAKWKLPFPLVVDEDGSLRDAYGVPKTFGLFDGRTTFAIDPKGIVRDVFNSQFKAKQHHRHALAVVKGTQAGSGGSA
jgi:peroxiredoxin Q/BCP